MGSVQQGCKNNVFLYYTKIYMELGEESEGSSEEFI